MKEEFLSLLAQKAPILPPTGPKDGEQAFRPGRWLVKTMSPSTMSSARKTLFKERFSCRVC